MTEEKMSAAAGCCQKELPPVQMQCCPGNALPGLQATAPSLPSLEKLFDLQAVACARIGTINLLARAVPQALAFSSSNRHCNNNHRYLLTASLLL
ncbi:MAG: hypothetical protein AAB354_05765 [candidate division KSB1 bacterium]